ncbi:MAG: DUF2341 domain-containing protein, partial [Thermoplasmata archaeon]
MSHCGGLCGPGRGTAFWVVSIALAFLSWGSSNGLFHAGEDDHTTEFIPWWNYAWGYRAPLTLDNSQNSETLTNYPVRINISAGLQALVSSGKLKVDLADLRFIDCDGATELSYWLEPGGDIWLKVPSIPSRSSKVVYMYYGNPSAPPVSSGDKVFNFFDDFSGNSLDTSKWLLIHPGSYSVSDGFFTIYADGSLQPGKAIALKASTENYYILRSKFKITGGYDKDERIGLSIKTGTSDGRGYNYVLRGFTALNEISFLDDFVRWDSRPGNWAKNTWYIEEIYHDGSSVRARLNDGEWQSVGWSGRAGYPALNFGSYDGSSVWDWALVRPYKPPEPKASLGQEERPVKFRSFSVAPVLLDEGDTVELNATFENPAPEEIRIRVSIHDGESFEGSREIYGTELALVPQAETEMNFTWIPEG